MSKLKLSTRCCAAILIAGLTILLLEGCVSMPKFTDSTKQLPPPRPGYGRIWFYRESRFVGSARHPDILLDGEKVGVSKPGGYFYVDRRAGNHVVTCESPRLNECRIVLDSESTKYVRFIWETDFWIGNLVPQEVSRSTALKELADL